MKQKSYSKKKILQGTIKKHSEGFGFVIPDNDKHPDIYIPATLINSAFTNDSVTVSVQKRKGKPGRFFGAVESIVKRHKEFATGTYAIIDNKEVLKNHNLSCEEYILVQNPNSIPLNEEDCIKVKITQYPDDRKDLKGEVVQNLGVITSSAKDDIKRVLSEFDIPLEFPDEVLEEVNQFPDTVTEKDFTDRKNLTDKCFVTIDGETAKDFDDAIYVEKQDSGYRLFVAIADVSYYVGEDTHLDQEAFARGNSTYLPDFCIPMLPEKLSNDLCSLMPLQPRLVMVAELDYDFQGELIKSQIYPSVIESKKRLTYEEVQSKIDGSSDLGDLTFLKLAQDLAKLLIKKHYQEGALNLEIEEINIVTNEVGEPIDFVKEERLFSHQLIEQFMLAANKAVSAFLEENDTPFMYRIHEEPKEDKLQHLETFSKSLGHLTGLNSRKDIIQFLSEFKDHPKNFIINKLVLRSLSQARYSAYNKSHYGLNFKSYTHFTSPIRRYCDLMIHRFIKKVLNKSDQPSLEEKDIENKSLLISGREQNSVKAERQVKDIKKARFLSLHLGKNFSGVISSVTSFGIFISLDEFDIEGLVRLKDLPEHWIADEVHLSITAKRSGYTMKCGDKVEIQVVATNPLTGHIDFQLLSHQDQPLPKERAFSSDFSGRSSGRDSGRRGGRSSGRSSDRRGGRSSGRSSDKKRFGRSSDGDSRRSSGGRFGRSSDGDSRRSSGGRFGRSSDGDSRRGSGGRFGRSSDSSRKKPGRRFGRDSERETESFKDDRKGLLKTRPRPRLKVNSRFKKDSSAEDSDSRDRKPRGRFSKDSDSRGAKPRGRFSKDSDSRGAKPRGRFSKDSDSRDRKPRGRFSKDSDSRDRKPRGRFSKDSDSRDRKPRGRFSKDSDSKSAKPRGRFSKDSDSRDRKPRGRFSKDSDSRDRKPRGRFSKDSDSRSRSAKPRGRFSKDSDSRGAKPRGRFSKDSDSRSAKPRGRFSKDSDSRSAKPRGRFSKDSDSRSRSAKPRGRFSKDSGSRSAKPRGRPSKDSDSRSRSAKPRGRFSKDSDSRSRSAKPRGRPSKSKNL